MKRIDFFKNKYVLVTGSSSGIGYEIAKDFLKRGCYVGVHYNKNKRGADNLVKFSDNNKCKLFKSDFSNSYSRRSVSKNSTFFNFAHFF